MKRKPSGVKDTLHITSAALGSVGAVADRLGAEVYVVGGYVRDLLLGREVEDIDITVLGDGVAFAREAAEALGARPVVVFEKFGTAMVPYGGGKIEFVSARQESYSKDSRKPDVKRGTLTADLSRRDFTVNAIAASLNAGRFGEIVDPFDGRADLAAGLLRTPLEPRKTFDDDPLRMMRALRFAAQLQFRIQPEALTAIGAMAGRLAIVSRERITDEFMKILASPKPSIGLSLLQQTGLAKHVFPELTDLVGVEQRKDYHHKDVFLHTLKVVDNICESTGDVWLRFAALVHDIAKPRTKAFKEDIGWTFHGHEDLGARMMKSIFRRLRLPMDRLPYVEKLVRLHLRPMVLVKEEITDSAIRRLLFDAGEDIDDLMKLCRADITSQNPSRVVRYLKNYDIVMEKMREVEEMDRLRNWQPPVRGEEIMQICGIEPGPIVGVLKKRIEDAILEGTIPNEHDPALEYLLKIKDEILGG
ncbi:MAG TPA: CCA tRNA nucleotidyltransferase [Bacteroidota bacterium]|nr:CCA tRNA nucleotidyltransferase [Bacteroidota bacterium]